jgi:hypothetical protein
MAQRSVVYWAVALDLKKILENNDIKKFLDEHQDLIMLKEVHSTLLFVGRKKKTANTTNTTNLTDLVADLGNLQVSNTQEPYMKLDGKECQLVVKQFGYSANAMALEVKEIKMCEDDTSCPTNAVKQHVTMALSNGTKAVDSVKTLLGEGTIHTLTTPLLLTGTIKGFFY